MKSRLILTLALTAFVWCAMSSTAAADRVPARIVSHKQDQTVRRVESIIGEVTVPGRPVVLVRADLPGCLWWVQDPAQPAGRGKFKSIVRFGNAATRDGSRFRVVVLMVQTREQLAMLRAGEAMRALPPDMLRSAECRVEFRGGAVDRTILPAVVGVTDVVPSIINPESIDETASPGAAIDVITEPANGSRVARLTELKGQMSPEGRPFVLVKADAPGSLWWVQDDVVIADDEQTFRVRVRFGNDRTPDGAAFRVVVLMATGPDAFQVGQALRNLPVELPQSKSIRVVLDRNAG